MVVGNPVVLHPPLRPVVMSVKALYPLLYNQGFKNPRGGLPEEMSASLTRETMDAMSGDEALVPETVLKVWFHTMLK